MALVTCVWLGGLPAAAEEARIFSAAAPGQRLDDGGGEGERVAVAPGLASKLLTVELEGAARVHDWPVAPGLRRSILVRRHDVYHRTARVVVVVEGDRLVDVPRSPLVFLWGSIEGDEGGSVLLTVDPRTMTVEGASQTASGYWRLVPEAVGSHLLTRSPGSSAWACGVGCSDGDGATTEVRMALRPPAPRPISVLHTASVAVETDNELLSIKFGNNTSTATNYIAELFAAMNVMYERDLLIRLLQGFTVLRPSTTPDPYTGPESMPGGDGRAQASQLLQFSTYWEANFGGIDRALVSMLSGKQPDASTSGYATVVSNLCSTQAAGGSYNFSQVYTSPARPAADDVREVGHEIGHNFGTRHTHCPPHTPFADVCWSGESGLCFLGLTSCPAPQTYSGIPNVRGTIMSWCDRRPEQDCPVTNVFHPQTIAIIEPHIDAAVGQCVFPVTGPPPPAPTSIDPTIGPIAGGTSVTITGTNFQTGASVGFADGTGTTPLASVTVVNSTTITGTTPPHVVGAVDVVVSNPDQQSSSLPAAFTYRAHPTITAVVPNGGPTSGGTEVAVTGTGFVAPATLTLGGTPATGVTVVSPTSITATTAAHPVGIVDVSVGLPGGLSGTMASGYFYTPVSLPVAFYTLPPCRLVDTRGPSTPLGGPALAPAERRTLLLEGVCGLPAAAKAVSVNLTVVQPTNPGFLTLYPSDGLSPVASNLNFSPGQTRANNAVLVLATDGSDRLTVFNGSNGTTHVILDVNGYFK